MSSTMQHVVDTARSQRLAEEAMLSVVPISAHGLGESRLMSAWIDAGGQLDDALTQLDEETRSEDARIGGLPVFPGKKIRSPF